MKIKIWKNYHTQYTHILSPISNFNIDKRAVRVAPFFYEWLYSSLIFQWETKVIDVFRAQNKPFFSSQAPAEAPYNSSFWFSEAKEAVEVIEASDVIMSVEVIEATEGFKTT